MEWKTKYANKVRSAEEAVAGIRPGDTVSVAPYSCTPHTLCNALNGVNNCLHTLHFLVFMVF